MSGDGTDPVAPRVVKLDMLPTWVAVSSPLMLPTWVALSSLGVTDVGSGGVTDVGSSVLPTWVAGFCF